METFFDSDSDSEEQPSPAPEIAIIPESLNPLHQFHLHNCDWRFFFLALCPPPSSFLPSSSLADKCSVFLMDFMPQSTREWHCPWFLRAGRAVNWGILPIYDFGAPLVCAPMGGPIHNRADFTLTLPLFYFNFSFSFNFTSTHRKTEPPTEMCRQALHVHVHESINTTLDFSWWCRRFFRGRAVCSLAPLPVCPAPQ
jgi:hypothetical protein